MKIYNPIVLISTLLICSFTSAISLNITDPVQFLQTNSALIFQDNFDNELDSWVIEKTDKTEVSIISNKLDVDDGDGVTIWFKYEISSPSIIEFDGAVIVAGGENDRGTDLNFFWMANAPKGEHFFEHSASRQGKMRSYDTFQLYYIGYGANNNSTTRFRSYPGDGTRPLRPEFDVSSKPFMNVENVMTNIKIISLKQTTFVFSNNEKLYEINHDKSVKSGRFGFRTWKSHLRIDNFKVYKITD